MRHPKLVSSSSMAAAVFWLFCGAPLTSKVLADYPPPSEDSDGYYSMPRHQRGVAVSSRTPPAVSRRVVGQDGQVWEEPLEIGRVGGALSAGGCMELPSNLTLCRGIGYSHMTLPNLFGHDTLAETTQQAASWVLLVNIQCHPDTQIFLCSMFAPVCLDRPVWPCRSLCEAVRGGCEDRMLSYGYPWPDLLRCAQFPADNDMCIQPRGSHSKDVVSCPACSQPDTYDAIIDGYCNADFVMRIRINEGIVSGSDLKVIAAKKRKVYKVSRALLNEVRTSDLYVENGANCDCSKMDQQQQQPPHLAPTAAAAAVANSSASTSSSSTNRRQSTAGQLLVMGRRRGSRLIVTHAQLFDRRSAELRRAIKDMRLPIAELCRRRRGGGRRRHGGDSSVVAPSGSGAVSKVNRRPPQPPLIGGVAAGGAAPSAVTTPPAVVPAGRGATTVNMLAQPSGRKSTTSKTGRNSRTGEKRTRSGGKNGQRRSKPKPETTAAAAAAEPSRGGGVTGQSRRKDPSARRPAKFQLPSPPPPHPHLT